MEELAIRKEGLPFSLSNRENLLHLLDAAKSCDSRQQELAKVRFEDTGKWVLSTPQFVSWEKVEQVLWISGPPGSGKSVLM